MFLDKRPNRPLTSREIASILGGLIGSMGSFCRREDIVSAIEFLYENRTKYGAISEALGTLQTSAEDLDEIAAKQP